MPLLPRTDALGALRHWTSARILSGEPAPEPGCDGDPGARALDRHVARNVDEHFHQTSYMLYMAFEN